MKSFKITYIFLVLFSCTIPVFSQTQSLWSEIRESNSDSVGLSALQYQVPLVGEMIDFYDMEKIKGKNNWAGCHTWLVQDFNLDGFADIFLAFFTSEVEPVPFMLLIYDKNTGTYIDQSFRIKNNIGETFNRRTMAADFNGDGILDIVAISNPEKPEGKLSHLDVLLSNPDTTWTQKRLKEVDRFKGEGYYHGVAVGDIDKDGDMDIVLGVENNNYGGSLSLINDGSGNFKEIQVTSIDRGSDFETRAWTTELADINKDGCLDLMYWHDDLNTRILYGNCTETFDYAYQDFGSLEFPYIMDYDVGDFDGDGDYDLLLTTTDYFTGWQLVFRENKDIDNEGKVIWADNSEVINQSLKTEGFYTDSYSYEWVPYVDVVDINSDGFYDIIPQKPLSNVETFNQWILLGDNNWKFKYKKLPFAEPPKIITSEFTNSGKIKLLWERVKQDYSVSDGGIDKWAIYISNINWGDRSQVPEPIIVSAKDTKQESEFDEYILNPTSNEMFIRIAPIDSTGIEWVLSDIHKITISPPSILSTNICESNNLTITGENFIGIKGINIGGEAVASYTVLSESVIQAVLNSGQSGTVSVTTVSGNVTFSDVTTISPPSVPFVITGSKSPMKGSIENYNIPNVIGVTNSWSFPEGWEQISGSNTNSISVKVGTKSGNISVIPSVICGSLDVVSVSVSVYTYVPDDNFQNALRDLGIDQLNIPDSVLSSSIVDINEVNLNDRNISDLKGIQDFESLTSLNCWGNQLTDIDISQNKALINLDCGNNPLTSLDISNNTDLTHVSLYVCNTISSIDLSKNTNLVMLSCGFNSLTELDVSNNPRLQQLYCDMNNFKSLDLSQNTRLRELVCHNNNSLSSLNIKNGKNDILTLMEAYSCPNLTCINVDDPEKAATYPDWTKDATASYSDNCVKTNIGITELKKSIKIYPNPVTDELIIEFDGNSKETEFEIINSVGQNVYHGTLIEKQIVPTSNFMPGLYLLKLKTGEPFDFKKIIKQ